MEAKGKGCLHKGLPVYESPLRSDKILETVGHDNTTQEYLKNVSMRKKNRERKLVITRRSSLQIIKMKTW